VVYFAAPLVCEGFVENPQGQRRPMTWTYVHTCGELVYEAFGWWETPQLYCTWHNAFLAPTPTRFPAVLEAAMDRHPKRRFVDADFLVLAGGK